MVVTLDLLMRFGGFRRAKEAVVGRVVVERWFWRDFRVELEFV